jgi:diadenosine tetraphosphate (Ap4A) HIT family hydrolase
MSWKNKEKWQAMISGEDCPMCKDISLEENPFSYLVSELSASYVRLPKNQDIHGRVLVALKRHANELYELSSEELADFWSNVSVVAKAINDVFAPVKLYYGVFGGQCPHIHCHILPMREEDEPNAAITMGQTEKYLKNEEYEKIIQKLRSSIELGKS